MAHVSLVTLGVEDLDAATRFYESLGWERSPASVDGVVAFLEGGAVVLGLFGRGALAEDARVEAEPVGAHGNLALAMNVESEEEVDEALSEAAENGAALTRPAEATDWGGYSGYFRDPDGHLWEVAYNPGFELLADGSVILPDR